MPSKKKDTHGLIGDTINLAARLQSLAQTSVVGNAGTGKSRLIREFKAGLNLQEIQWREGHAYPYTQNRPYYPLINLMTHAFRIKDGDGPDTIREKVAEGIKILLWNRPEIIPHVGSLFALTKNPRQDKFMIPP